MLRNRGRRTTARAPPPSDPLLTLFGRLRHEMLVRAEQA
jgi:hypothetical protein